MENEKRKDNFSKEKILKENSYKDDIFEAIKTATRSNFAMSFYMPVIKAGHRLDAAFLYEMGDFTTMRTRPYASVLIEPETGTLLEYRNAYISDFVGTQNCPMSQKIDYSVPYAKTATEQGALVARVEELYKIVRELAWKEELTEYEKKTVREYWDCFQKAVPKDLVVFYKALAAAFWEWIEKICG